MDLITVNAIGDACPLPVVKVMKALAQMTPPGTLEAQVDNPTAVQNIMRFASSKNLKAVSEKLAEDRFLVRITVEEGAASPADEAPAPECLVDVRGDVVVAVGSNVMGHGDEALGAALMKAFLYALSQQEKLPRTILFYNGGAKLTTEGSVSVEDLKSMEAQGVEIRTCGTCLNFYGLTDKLAVGSVTNMYEIVETLTAAARVVRP